MTSSWLTVERWFSSEKPMHDRVDGHRQMDNLARSATGVIAYIGIASRNVPIYRVGRLFETFAYLMTLPWCADNHQLFVRCATALGTIFRVLRECK